VQLLAGAIEHVVDDAKWQHIDEDPLDDRRQHEQCCDEADGDVCELGPTYSRATRASPTAKSATPHNVNRRSPATESLTRLGQGVTSLIGSARRKLISANESRTEVTASTTSAPDTRACDRSTSNQ
jgi:hypothetical protein